MHLKMRGLIGNRCGIKTARLIRQFSVVMFFLGVALSAAMAAQIVEHNAGGGPPPTPQGDDISPAQRAQVAAILAAQRQPAGLTQPSAGGGSGGGSGDSGPAPYPFVPLAGNLWQDRFVLNFVDLDPSSPGILDWDCTDFTYDGHTGHDIDLRSFGEQDTGVPVFAALDGVVSATHDGEFDRNTVWNNQPANYVIVSHGGTHYSYYWHLRKNSVAVANGQFVYAGTQIGLAGSSGISTAPHLHFESQYNGAVYEPSVGNCRPGQSDWVNQSPVRRDLYIEDFAMHNTNSYPASAWLPYNPYRNGTIVRTGGFQPIGAWYIIHNLPAASTWHVRYLRPSATLFFDSGTQNYSGSGNPFYRYSMWWLWYGLNPDIAGTWTFELSVNGQVMVSAPFTVLNVGEIPTNRLPAPITAGFDPAWPTTNDAVFCRLQVPLLEDPDYDLVSYLYQWRANGQTIRTVTNAAFSDAIPRNLLHPGDLLTCTVTPYDGSAFGSPTVTQTLIAGGTSIQLTAFNVSQNQIAIRWPTSQVNYAVEFVTNLPAATWTTLTNLPTVVSNQNVVTLTNNGGKKFFRLRWP
jgi:murein DD-endopeptidase MepM/ murein hydrolase activator NlpD